MEVVQVLRMNGGMEEKSYAMNSMLQGRIEDEELDTFNFPEYMPSAFEVKLEVEKEGSFTVDRLEVSEVGWNAYDDEISISDEFKDSGYNVAKCIRAVTESLLATHFGEEILDELFIRYRKILSVRLAKEKGKFVSVTVYVTRKETTINDNMTKIKLV